MSMIHIHEFKRHTGSAFHGIFIATGRTKTTVATERDKFPIFTMCADIHGATIGRIANYFDVFHYNRSWILNRIQLFHTILSIFYHIHKIIMKTK